MAHNRSRFLEALNRSETRTDGGFKHSWSFSLPGDRETAKRHEAGVVSVEEMEQQQMTSPEKKSPPLRHYGSDHLRTFGNRSNMRSLNRLGARKCSDVPPAAQTPSSTSTRTDFNLILTSTLAPGIMLQGRHFQHAQVPSLTRKPAQRNNQAVEVDSIVLTCPEAPEGESLNIKRRVQQKRKPLENVCFSPQLKAAEPVRTAVYHSVCLKCKKPSEDGSMCLSCGSCESLVGPQAASSSPTPRPAIRSHPSLGPNSLQQKFYKAGAAIREALPPRMASSRAAPLPLSNGRIPLLAGTSGACRAGAPAKGRQRAAGQQAELNDPIVLSSDDEEEEAETASTESVNRMDNVSPQPADSAHSSPAPSGGKVEAAVKSADEQEELNAEFFEDVSTKITIPRRAKMKDQFGKQPSAEKVPPRKKRPRVSTTRCDSIILDCRSIRIGTMRLMVKEPVIVSPSHWVFCSLLFLLGSMCLQTAELISCEWCRVRKLPVLFFQTTVDECLRLRSQLNMSQELGGQWYDCSADQVDEKYIVLIFENGLVMKEQMILEDILNVIGQNNNLSGFPTKLTFEEANIRLVNYNKACSQKTEAKPEQASPSSPTLSPDSAVGVSTRTRMATRQQPGFDEDEDMTDLQPTFSGLVMKLIVYPPPPAKGGISVTNEDLHCLNDGEFLNDVIIDFYLKYLVLEKLKKEDAHRIHVFSSFFYKRLNQRERRSVPDTANLPIQKKKHNRVKTWTRHVDLFQKDFVFVPINESAHWYLAVICFPGLEGPVLEKNPMYVDPPPASSSPDEPQSEENIPDHCRPLSPDGDGLDSLSDGTSPTFPDEADSEPPHEHCGFPEVGEEQLGSSRAEPEQQFSSELQRIKFCYRSGDGDDAYTFSDDQSSCQDECSEDGNLAEDAGVPDVSSLASKPIICKQPCILIMDSLRGPSRSNVVKTLREYLEVEWEVRRGSQRSFGKDVMKGSSPRVPQQDNFSDCGVYVLQYVESFFENPIPSFQLPMNLSDWFPQQRMKTKRLEIKELILKIKDQQELDKKEAEQAEAWPGSPEEPEIEETPGPMPSIGP
ncbi:PREDICTED: sentrin-specific protease 6 [Cyprinodon variegatus]|uniref:sentrin-specific protease 6 n=1 Tax=Cyprinodon variegatus TaxID=28743 RepID=UPI00074271B6|nr:PREDICTED: sentrin-specific protease 6 [Cyprinodon variegatus]